jgi:hypothetical protein
MNLSIVRVVDDLSSGTLDNMRGHFDNDRFEMITANLLEPGVTESATGPVSAISSKEPFWPRIG